MVRKVGFGHDETETGGGQVRRGEPPRKSGKWRREAGETAGSVAEPAPASAAPEAPARPAAAQVTGKPRWGAIFVLLIILFTWLAMFGFVVISILERRGGDVPLTSMIWVVLSIYGTIVLMRKLGHLYRGGSWLQTPADAAREAGNDTA